MKAAFRDGTGVCSPAPGGGYRLRASPPATCSLRGPDPAPLASPPVSPRLHGMSATQLRALAGTSPLRRRRLGPHVTITRPRPSPTAGESLLASSTRTSGPNSSPTPDADEVQGASSPGVPRRWRSAGWAPGRARRSEAPDRVRRFCSAYSSSPGLSVAGGRGRTGGTPPRQPPPGSPCGEKLLEPSTSTKRLRANGLDRLRLPARERPEVHQGRG